MACCHQCLCLCLGYYSAVLVHGSQHAWSLAALHAGCCLTIPCCCGCRSSGRDRVAAGCLADVQKQLSDLREARAKMVTEVAKEKEQTAHIAELRYICCHTGSALTQFEGNIWYMVNLEIAETRLSACYHSQCCLLWEQFWSAETTLCCLLCCIALAGVWSGAVGPSKFCLSC